MRDRIRCKFHVGSIWQFRNKLVSPFRPNMFSRQSWSNIKYAEALFLCHETAMNKKTDITIELKRDAARARALTIPRKPHKPLKKAAKKAKKPAKYASQSKEVPINQMRLECVRLAIAAGAGTDVCNFARQIEDFIFLSNSECREPQLCTLHTCPRSSCASDPLA